MPSDHVSLSTTPFTLLEGGIKISGGTGFFIGHEESNGMKYQALVANYHVIAGSAPIRRKPPRGDSIEFELHESGADPWRVRAVRCPLGTVNEKPTWATSKSSPESDVVVIPIPVGDTKFDVPPFCLGQDWIDADIATYPGQPVSVVDIRWAGGIE